MTTIAWDGKTLAADKQATRGGLKGACNKLFKNKAWVYAACGPLSDAQIFWNALVNGEKVTGLDDVVHGLVVDRITGDVFSVEGTRGTMLQVGGPYAVGSGAAYATVALHLGKSAKEAVEIASEFDVYTGFGVSAFTP